MSFSQIIFKTLPYMLIRLLAHTVMTIILIAYMAICMGIFALFGRIFGNNVGFSLIILAVFCLFGIQLFFFLKSYMLYLIQSGHVAVISELAAQGSLPEGVNQFAYGKEMVKNNFATSSVLFGVDQLIKKAVKEIQAAMNTFDDWLSFIPGIQAVISILHWFIGIVLNYVDEAILAYIFQKQGENVWKSAADGIVLYVQNWKIILKAAGVILIGILIVYTLLFSAIFGTIFSLSLKFGLFFLAGPVSMVLVFLIIGIIKQAILDPVIMVYMVCQYLRCTQSQQPSYDLYEKLSGMSTKFREILEKVNEGEIVSHQPAPSASSIL